MVTFLIACIGVNGDLANTLPGMGSNNVETMMKSMMLKLIGSQPCKPSQLQSWMNLMWLHSIATSCLPAAIDLKTSFHSYRFVSQYLVN